MNRTSEPTAAFQCPARDFCRGATRVDYDHGGRCYSPSNSAKRALVFAAHDGRTDRMGMPVANVIEIARALRECIMESLHLPAMIRDKRLAPMHRTRPSANYSGDNPVGSVGPAEKNASGLQWRKLATKRRHLLDGGLADPDFHAAAGTKQQASAGWTSAISHIGRARAPSLKCESTATSQSPPSNSSGKTKPIAERIICRDIS